MELETEEFREDVIALPAIIPIELESNKSPPKRKRGRRKKIESNTPPPKKKKGDKEQLCNVSPLSSNIGMWSYIIYLNSLFII